MRILVTGGTGHLGRDIVSLLKDQGHHVRVLARTPGQDPAVEWIQGDLATGRGITKAVSGTEVIVHAATFSPAARRGTIRPVNLVRSPPEVDIGGTRQLLGAAGQAGVALFLYVSIVGVRHARVPYSRLKATAEDLVRQSGVQHSIVPSTQFYWLLDRMLGRMERLPVWPLPTKLPMQPADEGDFAAYVAGCVADGPARRPAAFWRTGHHKLRRGRRAVPGSPGAPAPDPPSAAPPRRRPRGRRPHLPRRAPRHDDLGRVAEQAPAPSGMRTPLPRNRFERPSVDPGPSGGPVSVLARRPAGREGDPGGCGVRRRRLHRRPRARLLRPGPGRRSGLDLRLCVHPRNTEAAGSRRRGARGRAPARGARRAPERRRRLVRLPRLDHHRPSPLKLRTEHNRAQPDEQSETASTIAKPDP